jgi:hypothetical protein
MLQQQMLIVVAVFMAGNLTALAREIKAIMRA